VEIRCTKTIACAAAVEIKPHPVTRKADSEPSSPPFPRLIPEVASFFKTEFSISAVCR
jgi:hypothetical protein